VNLETSLLPNSNYQVHRNLASAAQDLECFQRSRICTTVQYRCLPALIDLYLNLTINCRGYTHLALHCFQELWKSHRTSLTTRLRCSLLPNPPSPSRPNPLPPVLNNCHIPQPLNRSTPLRLSVSMTTIIWSSQAQQFGLFHTNPRLPLVCVPSDHARDPRRLLTLASPRPHPSSPAFIVLSLPPYLCSSVSPRPCSPLVARLSRALTPSEKD
jgi:hypothetical protein